MSMAPITRVPVSDQVFASLVDEILSGRIAPGDALPSERELAETFAVNRHAIREALKRLQQAGLVVIAQGGKTRVQDWREHAGLDLLSELAASDAVPAERLLADIATMRAVVGADAARLCAKNATAAEIARVVEAAETYPTEPTALAQLVAIDLGFWSAIIDGSHNVAYRLGLNTLVDGILNIGHEHVDGLAEEYADRAAHLRLARLIADRDGLAARTLAESLLTPTES